MKSHLADLSAICKFSVLLIGLDNVSIELACDALIIPQMIPHSFPGMATTLKLRSKLNCSRRRRTMLSRYLRPLCYGQVYHRIPFQRSRCWSNVGALLGTKSGNFSWQLHCNNYLVWQLRDKLVRASPVLFRSQMITVR